MQSLTIIQETRAGLVDTLKLGKGIVQTSSLYSTCRAL